MELELKDYIKIIWKRRWVIASIFIVAVVAAWFISGAITPVYRASTKILIKTAGAGQIDLFDQLGGTVRNQVQNYIEILKSRSLAKSMGESMGLDVTDKESRFAALQKGISIQPIQGSDAINVDVESTDPLEAATAANALVEAFKKRTQYENQSDVRAAREFIEKQLLTVQGQLGEAEDSVQDYQSEAGVVQPTQEATAIMNRLTQLETARAEAEVAIFEAQARRQELERQLSEREQTVISSQTLSENPVVAQYRKALADLQIQRAQALEKYAPHHPVVAAIDGQIADIEKRLADEIERVISTETVTLNPVRQALIQQALQVESEVIAAQARRDGLDRIIGEAEQQISRLPSQEVQLTRLMRNRSVLENIYVMLMEKLEEFRITEEMTTADVQVIDPAEIPDSPIKPRRMMNTAVAGMLALFVGCGLAFLIEYMDTSIKTAQDVEQYLDLPVLGLIPFAKLEDKIVKGNKTRFSKQTGRRTEGYN
jgi:polysaccharide chain length determinant protein (PEP-CTERM system associated)